MYAPPASVGLPPDFIARCNEASPDGTPLVLACQTDIFFGETLEARIRFPKSFLTDWAAFQGEMDTFLNGLLKAGR